MVRKTPEKSKGNGANVGYEAELWRMADALRGCHSGLDGQSSA